MTRWTFSWLAVLSIGVTGTANAQGRSDCRSAPPPRIGVAVGWSSPYLEPHADLLQGETGSVSVGGGVQLAGRVELPLAGLLRVRLEGASARWNVRRRLYAPETYTVIDDRSVGSLSARHLVALVGIRTGRAPVCAQLSAGGGLHMVGFEDTTLHRVGLALAAGLEAPTGGRGVLQADATIHLIRIGDGAPITNASDALTLSLLVGWTYRF